MKTAVVVLSIMLGLSLIMNIGYITTWPTGPFVFQVPDPVDEVNDWCGEGIVRKAWSRLPDPQYHYFARAEERGDSIRAIFRPLWALQARRHPVYYNIGNPYIELWFSKAEVCEEGWRGMKRGASRDSMPAQ
jgi:hypothetical protein